MKEIWKFALGGSSTQGLEMPVDAEVLSVQAQRDTPCVWALVDPGAETEVRTFKTYGTGHPIAEGLDDLHFVGTFQLSGGALVFHLFETKGTKE